jgi:hypothetical protein
MTSKTEIIEKIRKVQALADRGVDGEKENAARMVERLMAEHDITEEELRDDIIERRWFRYASKDKYARKLMAQVIYTVTGEGSFWTRGRKAMAGVECTAAQGVEIAAMFEFYYAKFTEDIDMFYAAFLSKNDIYPSNDIIKDDEEDDDDEPEIDVDRALKIGNMMKGMEKHEFRKQLGGN